MVYCLYPKYHTFQLIVKFIVSKTSDYDTLMMVSKAIYAKLLLLFCDILWYNIDYILETTILRMYVEGDKGTGRFDFTVGVLVCGFFYDYGGCNRLFHKIQSNPNNQPPLFNS